MSKGGKLKTNKSVQKRFRRKKSGKFTQMRAGKRHLATGKSASRKRHGRKGEFVSSATESSLRRLMPYA